MEPLCGPERHLPRDENIWRFGAVAAAAAEVRIHRGTRRCRGAPGDGERSRQDRSADRRAARGVIAMDLVDVQTTNPLRALNILGQSIWLDSISRRLIGSGELSQ